MLGDPAFRVRSLEFGGDMAKLVRPMKTKPVRSLAYCSKSSIPLTRSREEVRKILDVSIERNRRLQITGALTLVHDVFFQVLEGPASAVEDVLTSIRRDSRNERIVVVSDVERPKREFSDWDMHFAEPYSPERSLAYDLLKRLNDGEKEPVEPMLGLLKRWARS